HRVIPGGRGRGAHSGSPRRGGRRRDRRPVRPAGCHEQADCHGCRDLNLHRATPPRSVCLGETLTPRDEEAVRAGACSLIAPSSSPAYGDRGGWTMRVLVIEDHARMAELIERGLRRDSYAVDVAASGEQGLRLASNNEYDAVVLDLVLPGLDGFDVLRRLRASGTWTPVLVLTARDAVDDRVRGLDAGADDYLTKPFAFPEFLARIRAL